MIKISNIIINPGTQYEAELVPGSDYKKYYSSVEFSDEDNVYFYFDIFGNASNQNGLLYGTSYATIQSTTPIHNEIEKKIIEDFKSSLSNLPQPQWQEGRHPMLEMMEDATGDKYTDKIEEINEIPGQETKPLPKGVSLSSNGLLMIFGPRPGEVDYLIKSILRVFESTIKPFIDNNLISYYSIDSNIYENKIIRSGRGKQIQEEFSNNENIEIGYLKYVISTVLNRYPLLLKKMTNYINSLYPNIAPQNNIKIDLSSSDFVKNFTESGSTMDYFIIKSIISFDDSKLSFYENLLNKIKSLGINEDTFASILYSIEDGDLYNIELKSVLNYGTSTHHKSFLDANIIKLMHDIGYGDFSDQYLENFRKYAQKAIINENKYDIYNKVVPYLDILKLPDSFNPQISSAISEVEKENEMIKKKQEEKDKIRKLKVNWDSAIWNLNDFSVIPLSSNYSSGSFINYIADHFRDFTWLDGDKIFEEALENASNKMYEEIEGAPSLTYGKDKKEVNLDIKYEGEDFIESEDLWNFLPNNPSDEDITKLIINKYYDNFIKWKKKQMQEEEKDDYRYHINEDGPEDQDIQEEIENLVEDYALNAGVAFVDINWDNEYKLKGSHGDVMEIIVKSNFLDKAKEMLQTIVKYNVPNKKEEKEGEWDERDYPLPPDMYVEFYLSDEKKSDYSGKITNFRSAISKNWYKRAS